MIFRKTLTTLSKLHIKTTSPFSVYNIVKHKDLNEPAIPVYESNVLKGLKVEEESYSQIFNQEEVLQRYIQLIPFNLEKLFFKHKKHFITKMELLPKAETLKLVCLAGNGVYTKYVDLTNLIPVCEADYREFTRSKLFGTPNFVDLDMVYFNTVLEEFYVFDKEAEWKEEGLAHPALDLKKRFNEKQWLDTRMV